MEGDCVAVLLGLGHGFGADRLAVRRARLQLFNLCAGGQIELEVVIAHLRLRGRRHVTDYEQAYALHRSAVGLEAQDVGSHAQAADFCRNVIHLDVNRVSAGRRHLMISNSLMNGADEVRLGSAGEFEAEFSVAVGLGAASNVHTVGDVNENDFIACGGLAGGAVGDGAGKGLGGG